MAAPRQDDVTIQSINGTDFTVAVLDQDSILGITVQLRGVAVACSAATCTVYRGSASVSPACSVAVTGEISTTLTSANLTTLGAQILDVLEVHWQFTITDGSSSPVQRYVTRAGVSSHRVAWPVDFARIKRRIPSISKTQAIPSGQSSFWDNVRDYLTDFRDHINLRTPPIYDWLVANPMTLARAAEAFVCAGLCRDLAGADLQQSAYRQPAMDFQSKFDAIMSEVTVRVKSSSAGFDAIQVSTGHAAMPTATFYGSGRF